MNQNDYSDAVDRAAQIAANYTMDATQKEHELRKEIASLAAELEQAHKTLTDEINYHRKCQVERDEWRSNYHAISESAEAKNADLLECEQCGSKEPMDNIRFCPACWNRLGKQNASLAAQVSITKDLLLEAKELLRHTSCKYPREGEFPCQACLMEEKIDSINITAVPKEGEVIVPEEQNKK